VSSLPGWFVALFAACTLTGAALFAWMLVRREQTRDGGR